MPLTSQLGTSDSQLANIQLGLGVTSFTFDETPSQTLTLTQVVSVSITYVRGLSDSLVFVDTAGQSYPRSASNTLTFGQIATGINIGNTQVHQTLILTQTVVSQKVISRNAQNSLVLSHSDSQNHTTVEDITHTLTFVDVAVRIKDGIGSNTLTMTHTLSVLHALVVSANNFLLLSQTVTKSATFNRLLAQGLVLHQSATRTLSKVEGVTSTLLMHQTVIGISTKLAANTLTITGVATVDLVKAVRQILDFDQIVAENHTSNRHLFSNFIPFQVLSLSWTIRRTITQVVVFVQTATGLRVKFASNHLSLTQEADGEVVKPAFNNIVLIDSVTLSKTTNKLTQQTITLSHGVLLRRSRSYTATNIVAFNQFAKATKVISVAANNTLVLHQQLFGIGYDRAVTQALSLAQTVVKQKVATKNASNVLNLSHNLSVVKTLNLHVSQQLPIHGGMQKYVGLGNVTTIDIPEVQVVKVENFMVLQSDTQAITLPAPEFGDGEGARAKLNIKRAMAGVRYVYKKDAPSSRLSYELIISRKKAIEFRNFLMNNNSKVLTLTNWKGEIWAVLLTNNPFIFTEVAFWDDDCGNKTTIPLEFEGVRLN